MFELKQRLKAYADSIAVPPPPDVDDLEATLRREQGQRRGGWTVGIVAAAAALVVIGTVAAVAWVGDSPEEREIAPAADWSGIPAPWTDGDLLRFGQVAMPRPQRLVSVAATQEAAIVASHPAAAESGTDQLIAKMLAQDGTVTTVETHMVGIPIADPAGDLAAWTATSDGALVLVVFDTAAGRILGRLPVQGDMRVVAVDQGSVYVSDMSSETLRWTESRGVEPVSTLEGVDGMLTDVSNGRHFTIQRDQSVVYDAASSVLGTFDAMTFGTFSPDGQYAALTGQQDVFIWDSAANTTRPLPVPAEVRADTIRWASNGTLVVRVVPAATGDVITRDTEVTYLACLPDADCSPLPGGVVAELADGIESSAAGQFLVEVGP